MTLLSFLFHRFLELESNAMFDHCYEIKILQFNIKRYKAILKTLQLQLEKRKNEHKKILLNKDPHEV